MKPILSILILLAGFVQMSTADWRTEGKLLLLNMSEPSPDFPPVFVSSSITNSTGSNYAREGKAYSGAAITGSATDANGDAITYSIVSGPAWLSLTIFNTLTGIPTDSDAVGWDSWTIQASSSGGTDTAELVIYVAQNQAPVLGGSTKTLYATEDTYMSSRAYGFPIICYDADDDDYDFVKVSGESWLTFDNLWAKGTPPSAGTNLFDFVAYDGIDYSSSTGTIRVIIAAAPVAASAELFPEYAAPSSVPGITAPGASYDPPVSNYTASASAPAIAEWTRQATSGDTIALTGEDL